MKIKTVDVTEADYESAALLFNSLEALHDIYWPDQYKVKVLDAFARNGQLTIKNYQHWNGVEIHAWELSKEHEAALQSIASVKTVAIGCSYARADKVIATRIVNGDNPEYNMIVIDTPQGLHKSADGVVHVEHFDFLKKAWSFLPDKGGVIVLYVNTKPYNKDVQGEHGYDQYEEYNFESWMNKREGIYGKFFPKISEVIAAYENDAASFGWRLVNPLLIPCFSDVPSLPPYAFRLAFRVVLL